MRTPQGSTLGPLDTLGFWALHQGLNLAHKVTRSLSLGYPQLPSPWILAGKEAKEGGLSCRGKAFGGRKPKPWVPGRAPKPQLAAQSLAMTQKEQSLLPVGKKRQEGLRRLQE